MIPKTMKAVVLTGHGGMGKQQQRRGIRTARNCKSQRGTLAFGP